MHTVDLKEALKIRMEPSHDTLLKTIAFQLGVPGNVVLAEALLKMQATINSLEANQRLMQARISELEGAQELP